MVRAQITVLAAALAIAATPACDGQLPRGLPSPDAAAADDAGSVNPPPPVDAGPIDPPPPPPVDAGPVNPPVADEEGLPIAGPLPQASASCTFTHAPSGFTETASW